MFETVKGRYLKRYEMQILFIETKMYRTVESLANNDFNKDCIDCMNRGI